MNERSNKMLEYALIAVLALLTYFAVYLLCNYGLRWLGTYDWRFESATISPAYAFMPFIGFALVFYGLYSWQKKFKEKKTVLAVLFIFFILFSLLAFWLNLWFFYRPNATSILDYTKNVFESAGKPAPKLAYTICMADCKTESSGCVSGVRIADIALCTHYQVNFWKEFFKSAFFVFWIAGIFAGVLFFLYDMLAGWFVKHK